MTVMSQEFINVLKKTPKDPELLALSGDVFLSSWETMTKGPLYILGFNPGGTTNGGTIEDSLHSTDAAKLGYSAYLDETWLSSHQAGAHWHQLRVKEYLKHLNKLDPRRVPASNVLFITGETIEKNRKFSNKRIS